eukprot:gene8972-921_t
MSDTLQKERKNINFDTKSLTDLFNGGSKKTELKEKIYKKVYQVEAFKLDDFYFLSREERMKRVHEKCYHLQKFLHENSIKPLSDEFWIVMNAINDDLPLLIHYFLFIPTIMGQSDEEQLKIWGPKANNCEIIGCYAQTEIGHGSNVRGIETTATFNPETDEFELHSPTLTSAKCWIGSLGLTCTHAVVFAQLIIYDKNYGVHPFLTPIRSLEDHKPFKGLSVGDIGPKFGFNGMDNGFLKLNHYRIPRRNMLMKFAKVTKEGVYSRPPHEKTAYGTMIFARVSFLGGSANHLSKATTIGIRYGLQRKQFHSKLNQKGETLILDYPSQQYKLFPLLATAYGFKFTSQYIWNLYGEIMKSMSTSDFSFLGEFHALLSGLKSTFTDISANGIEECRKACGGHGYSKASGLADQYSFFVHYCTAEGDNTIMAHQLSKFLKKSYLASQQGKKSNLKFFTYLDEMKTILKEKSTIQKLDDCLNPKFQLNALRHRIAYLVNSTFSKNSSFEDEMIEGIKMSKAQSIYVVAISFIDSIQTFPENLKPTLKKLSDLFCLYYIDQGVGDLLMDQYLNEKQVEMIRLNIKILMKEIRHDAIGLVDAFNWTDRDLNSALGSKDGNAYENLMEFYERNPLNHNQVTPSYHDFIRPIIKQQYSKL